MGVKNSQPFWPSLTSTHRPDAPVIPKVPAFGKFVMSLTLPCRSHQYRIFSLAPKHRFPGTYRHEARAEAPATGRTRCIVSLRAVTAKHQSSLKIENPHHPGGRGRRERELRREGKTFFGGLILTEKRQPTENKRLTENQDPHNHPNPILKNPNPILIKVNPILHFVAAEILVTQVLQPAAQFRVRARLLRHIIRQLRRLQD